MHMLSKNDMIVDVASLSNILTNEKVLIIDKDDDLYNHICHVYASSSIDIKANLVLINQSDLKPFTKHTGEYINAFDAVLCPHFLYDVNCTNRIDLLKCIVWAMAKASRLVFAMPNIKYYLKILRDSKKALLDKEKNMYIFKYENSLVIKHKTYGLPIYFTEQYWNTNMLMFPDQLFKVWNSEYPDAQWKIDTSEVLNKEKHSVLSLMLDKKIILYS